MEEVNNERLFALAMTGLGLVSFTDTSMGDGSRLWR
jgi:hypothetical protein